MNKYPIYIISKGRAENRPTAKAFEKMNISYRIVIEPHEYDQYAAVIDPAKILVLPFSNLGQGSIPARNWVWRHSIKEGHARHWIVDDNIVTFHRWHQNRKRVVLSENYFLPMEEFVDRYVNIPMAGPNYYMFIKAKYPDSPIRLNVRVYSCILLSNETKHQIMWRGRYNEDTDLSLRYLKAGYCTILFNAFLIWKAITMKMKGGNTDELYRQDDKFDGRFEMAKSLRLQHPDVVKITRKWGRWQHQVDYRPFKKNKLIQSQALKYHRG